jgi:hypothetical protein
MRHLYLFLSLLCLNAFSQEKIDSTNIYLRSLKLHLAYLEDNYKKSNLSLPYTVNVEVDEQTTINLPNQIDNFRISYLNKEDIKKLAKKESIQLIVMRPVVIFQNSLIINIIDFNVRFSKNNFNYSNGGGSKIEFIYDCKDDYFKVSNIKQGGI